MDRVWHRPTGVYLEGSDHRNPNRFRFLSPSHAFSWSINPQWLTQKHLSPQGRTTLLFVYELLLNDDFQYCWFHEGKPRSATFKALVSNERAIKTGWAAAALIYWCRMKPLCITRKWNVVIRARVPTCKGPLVLQPFVILFPHCAQFYLP